MNNRIQAQERVCIYPGWVYMALLMFSYVIAGINTYRLQPVLTTVMGYLSVNESNVGLLMSICTFVSLCCSIPLGVLIGKLGCRPLMTTAILVEIVGSLVGYLFTNYLGIAISQLLFGLTSTIAMVCAPYFLQMVYDKQKFSMNIGYLNSCQTAGMAAAFLIPPLFVSGGYVPWVWLWTMIPAAVMLVLWVALVGKDAERVLRQRTETASETPESADHGTQQQSRASSPVKSAPVWRITLGTFFIMFSAGAVLSFASSYLTTQRAISEMTAARIVLSSAIVGMVCCAATGWTCKKLGQRRTYVVIVLILAVLRLLTVIAPDGIPLYAVMALQGVPAAGIVVVNAVIPTLCPNVAHRPLVISMIATANTAGMCVSAAVFGVMIIWFGYNGAFLALIPLSLLALIGTSALPKR